jgi:hypothetical protein
LLGVRLRRGASRGGWRLLLLWITGGSLCGGCAGSRFPFFAMPLTKSLPIGCMKACPSERLRYLLTSLLAVGVAFASLSLVQAVSEIPPSSRCFDPAISSVVAARSTVASHFPRWIYCLVGDVLENLVVFNTAYIFIKEEKNPVER